MNVKKAFFNALAITGAIVGVGFASGREVYSFFAKFGYLSLLMCFFAGLLFALICYLVLRLSYLDNSDLTINKKRKIEVSECEKPLRNDQNTKKYKFDTLFNIVLFICQIAICSAMFAGISSVVKSLTNNLVFSVAIRFVMFIFCFIYLFAFKKGVYFLNAVLSIFMFALICVLLVYSAFNFEYNITASSLSSSYLPLLYVGMNIFTAYPLIYEIGKFIKSKKQMLLTSVVFGVTIFLSLTLVVICLFTTPNIGDMPMLELARGVHPLVFILYSACIILSIITTCLSTAYGASRCFNFKYGIMITICLILSFALSFVGFSCLIDFVYPFIGLICLIVVTFKFLIGLKKRKKPLYDV